MKQASTSIRWLYLVVGVIALLFAGILYAWSILKAPLAAEFGWSAADLALNFTLTMCFFCLGGMAGGLLAKRLGTRLTLILAALLACAGFLLTARLSGQSVAMLYVSYGASSAARASASLITSSSPPPARGFPTRKAPAPAR